MQYFFIMKKITETISDKTLKASHKSSLESELVQFLSMEHCTISKDLLTTPLTTKISATFSKSKQAISLLMIRSETRIGPIFNLLDKD